MHLYALMGTLALFAMGFALLFPWKKFFQRETFETAKKPNPVLTPFGDIVIGDADSNPPETLASNLELRKDGKIIWKVSIDSPKFSPGMTSGDAFAEAFWKADKLTAVTFQGMAYEIDIKTGKGDFSYWTK